MVHWLQIVRGLHLRSRHRRNGKPKISASNPAQRRASFPPNELPVPRSELLRVTRGVARATALHIPPTPASSKRFYRISCLSISRMKKRGVRSFRRSSSPSRTKSLDRKNVSLKEKVSSSASSNTGFWRELASLFTWRTKRGRGKDALNPKKTGKNESDINVVSGRYNTPLDELYSLVQAKTSLPLAEVAKKFRISEELAEEWAKILESHHLLVIHYPSFGGPLLMRCETHPEKKSGEDI